MASSMQRSKSERKRICSEGVLLHLYWGELNLVVRTTTTASTTPENTAIIKGYGDMRRRCLALLIHRLHLSRYHLFRLHSRARQETLVPQEMIVLQETLD